MQCQECPLCEKHEKMVLRTCPEFRMKIGYPFGSGSKDLGVLLLYHNEQRCQHRSTWMAAWEVYFWLYMILCLQESSFKSSKLQLRFRVQAWLEFLRNGDDCSIISFVNIILVNRYFQSEFSETRFRAIYVKWACYFANTMQHQLHDPHIFWVVCFKQIAKNQLCISLQTFLLYKSM